jgi:hypothetical protein
VDDDQARLGQQRVVVFREDTGQRAPAFGRIAQAEALGDLARQTPAFEVGNRTGAGLEVLAVGLARFFQYVGQAVGLGLGCLGAGTFFGRLGFLGHLHADLLGQVLDGFDEAHAGVLHQKADGIAVFAATKAMEKLFGRADAEAG